MLVPPVCGNGGNISRTCAVTGAATPAGNFAGDVFLLPTPLQIAIPNDDEQAADR